MDRALLVLDPDETLLHASEVEIEVEPDFYSEQYLVRIRPHFEEFKKRMLATFRVAVWTAGYESYAQSITNELFDGNKLEFVWSRDRCTRKFDEHAHDHYWIKNLRKCEKKGYSLNRLLMVDNTPRKLCRNYGNLVKIKSFYGETDGIELLKLADYLEKIAHHENYRTLEKRGWRSA
ncbi:MAG: NIF family HAD-type phosphatase [Gammaproteobacteria bacterium]